MLDLVMHAQDRSTDGLSLPGGNDLHRAHKILIQGLPLEEKQKMATLLMTDKKAAGQLIYDRLTSKKDQILSLLDTNDEDLVNSFLKSQMSVLLVRLVSLLRLTYSSKRTALAFGLIVKRFMLSRTLSAVILPAYRFRSLFTMQVSVLRVLGTLQQKPLPLKLLLRLLLMRNSLPVKANKGRTNYRAALIAV